MAVVRIQDLSTAPVALTGTEPVEIEQGGVSYKTTTQAIADLAGAPSAVPIQEEGSTVVATPTAINFVGAGVTATASGSVATVTIPGGGGGGQKYRWNGLLYPIAQSSTISALGFAAPTSNGSPSGAIISSSSAWSSLPRILYDSTGAVGLRDVNGPYMLVGSSGVGGFNIRMSFGVGQGATLPNHRMFIGLYNSFSAPTDTNPSTYTDIIGIGYDSGDANVQVMHNDGSGTATKINLGSSFPKPTASNTNFYDLTLVSDASGSGAVAYTVVAQPSGATATGTISTNLPSTSTTLTWWTQVSAGGTGDAVSIAVFGLDAGIGQLP